MRLLISTPTAFIADDPTVVSVRAADESGSFGILQGHADFLTALSVSVVGWRLADGQLRFCAVRHGVLTVRCGTEVSIATRQAILGDDLDHLEDIVLAEMHRAVDADRVSRTQSLKLQMKAIRQIVKLLHPAHAGGI